MVKSIRYGLFLALVALAAVAQGATLKDFEGQPHKLQDYTGQGKWLVVMFWASDCHVCNMEAEQYVQFHEAHKDEDAQILGISLDGQERLAQAKEFTRRHDVTFPNLIGEPKAVANMFMELTGARWVGTPTFLIFSPQGELLAQQAGAVPTHLIEEFIQSQQTPAADKVPDSEAPAPG